MPQAVFIETQRYRQVWFWGLIFAFWILFIYQAAFPFITNNPDEFSLKETVIPSTLLILVNILLYVIKLETRITHAGIQYRLYPLQLRFRNLSWDDIDKVYIRTYRPILDYGGWGLRLGLFGKGRAVNIWGNKGLQLELKNGKKLLIGTQNETELAEVIANYCDDVKYP